MSSVQLLCLCRIGFEKEVASELNQIALDSEVNGYVKAVEKSGYAVFVCTDFSDAHTMMKSRYYPDLVFIRHWMITEGLQGDLDTSDRATPLAEKLRVFPQVSEVTSVNFDTNDGKSLSGLAQAVSRHVTNQYRKQNEKQHKKHVKNSDWLGQVIFVDGQSAYVGVTLKAHISQWPGGIPRLRVPRAAPSRATLKLEEAWHQFIVKEDWDTRLAPSMRAVDLGAAPGGWTWQLVNRSMFVDAVDNGPMAESLMESGQVKHHIADGFAYKPIKAVDWLVCDIADKPSRVTRMILLWATNRWFGEAVFNLKLPMKQRYLAIEEAKETLTSGLSAKGIKYRLRFKQLYHDREEVTAHLRLYP